MEEKQELKNLGKLAAKVMSDHQMMRSLSDKVYKLMLEDLRQQKERSKK